MIGLAREYAAEAGILPQTASGAARQTALLAAGRALLYRTGQRAVGGVNIALLLISIAGVLVSAVMIRSRGFGTRIGVIGILAYGFSIADCLRQAITTDPVIPPATILPGALLLVAWLIAVALRLLQLAASPPRTGGGDS